MILKVALVIVVTFTTGAADEIVFLSDGFPYFTDSNGADPGPIKDSVYPSAVYSTDLSPDGRYLLLSAYVYKSYGEWYEIAVMSRLGEVLNENTGYPTQKIIFGEYATEASGNRNAPKLYSARWSPDGSQILFARKNELLVVPFREEGHLQQFPVGSDVIHYCHWATDGRFVISTRIGEIWITDGTVSHFLGEGINPNVSPDGKKIAFVQAPGFDGNERNGRSDKEIWTMNLDGSGRELVCQYTGSMFIDDSHICWSPGSREIAFFDGGGINAVSSDGIVRNILDFPVKIESISWSPSWGIDLGTGVLPTSWGGFKRQHDRVR